MAKKIVFYCGFNPKTECGYVRNGQAYLEMDDQMRAQVLTDVIGELCNELEFVMGKVIGLGTPSECRALLDRTLRPGGSDAS
jgi:hypothetical protein